MATSAWDQSGFSTSNGYNISAFVQARDFTLTHSYTLGAATVWLVDVGLSNDGVLDGFSETISWGIFTDAGDGNGPVALLDSGSGVELIQTDTGSNLNGGGNGDIIRVDFSFEVPIPLDAGTYWFALHAGDWGAAYVGTPIYWVKSETIIDQPRWLTQNVTSPETGWYSSPEDSAFVLYSVAAPPVIISNGGGPTATISVAENTQAVVATVTASDVDVLDTLTYSINGTDAALLAIDATTGALSFRTAPNFEAPADTGRDNVYDVTVRATDNGGLYDEQVLAITVTDVYETPPNAAPRFTGPSELSIGENQFAIAALTATDPDGDSLTYKIAGGDDAALFSIDAKTGMLSFIHAPDFETPGSAADSNEYQVRVEVSDGSLDASKLFHISVTDSNDEKFGTAGNDVFHAGAAFGHFLGGDGRDTVIFKGSHDDYAINVLPDGRVTVGHGNGIDTLESIERLQFDDGTLAFDADGNAGQMFRLYQAVFGREPDAEGLGYWVHHQDMGQSSFQDVARSFMASPEFEQRYGNEDTLSNSAFLDLLYQNVLGRDPDADGFSYWVDKLDTGQTNFGDLLAFFSDSNENIAGTAHAVSDGIWFV